DGEKHRLVAGMVEEKDFVWFLVMSGVEANVDKNRDAFDAILTSVHFAAAPPIDWKLPPGWVDDRANKIRYATLRPNDGSIESKVTSLPTKAPMATDVLAIVNRWAGQIGHAELDKEDLPKVAKTIKIHGRDATFVDLVGTPLRRGARPPKMVAQAPP